MRCKFRYEGAQGAVQCRSTATVVMRWPEAMCHLVQDLCWLHGEAAALAGSKILAWITPERDRRWTEAAAVAATAPVVGMYPAHLLEEGQPPNALSLIDLGLVSPAAESSD